MKCVAIGDMFISKDCFDIALKDSPLFSDYKSFAWKEDEERSASRKTVRQIEINGFTAFEISGEIAQAVEGAEVLFVNLCPISGELINRAKKLRYLVTTRGGTENLDIPAAKECNVTVIYCPAHNAVAVAEYTIALMLCEMRNVVRSNISLKSGNWREHYPNSSAIPELRTSCVGIIGYGTIGRLVAERLKTFGSTILVDDPFVDPCEIKRQNCIPVTRTELLEKADIITLHGRIPVDAAPLIGKYELEQMKSSAYLINTARASLVDMKALMEALSNKVIMGAAIDVFPTEPIPCDNPFLTLDCVTITNHRGGDTLNSYSKAPQLVFEQLEEVITYGNTKYMI